MGPVFRRKGGLGCHFQRQTLPKRAKKAGEAVTLLRVGLEAPLFEEWASRAAQKRDGTAP